MEGSLPPTAADGHRIGAISALSAPYRSNGQHILSQRLENRGFLPLTATETTAAAAATVTAISAATTTTTAVPNHLGQARINVLLRLLENTNEVTSLLSIWMHVSTPVT